MHSYSSFEQIQQKSAMYLASNKMLKSTSGSEVDLCNLYLFEVKNQSYDSVQANLYAMENVLDAMKEQMITFAYIIQGTGNKLRYYYGVAPYEATQGEQRRRIHEIQQGKEILYASFTANYPDSTIVPLSKEEKENLQTCMCTQGCSAVLEGVPGVITGTSTSLGMDRFAFVMMKEEFVVMVLAKPLPEEQVMEITCKQQEVLDDLAPLLGYTKVNQKSNVDEASSSVERNKITTNSKTNTVSSQLQFQLYSANTSVPLQLDNATLRQIEEIFFSNGIDYDDSVELINALLTELEKRNDPNRVPVQGITRTREAVENDTTVSPPILNNLIVTTKEISGRDQHKYQPIHKQKDQQDNSIQKPRYDITEKNVNQIGNKLYNYLGYGTQENSPVTEAEDTILGQQGDRFSLANISRQDSRSQSKLASCSRTNRLYGSKRDSRTNICSITEKYDNQAANAWYTYVVDILQKRLLYGENRGLYVFSTVIYGKDQLTREKVIAAWNGMNDYTTVSKVPIRAFGLVPSSNPYCSYLNFQIPSYCYSYKGHQIAISMQECLARNAYSQVVNCNCISGGNWVSSKELRYFVTLPLTSTTSLSFRSGEQKASAMQIMEVHADKTWENRGHGIRKKDGVGMVLDDKQKKLPWENRAGYEDNSKRMEQLIEQYQKPFMIITSHPVRYSKAFRDKQKVERYDLLRCAGHILRLNPFELFPEELLSTHIDLLTAIIRYSYGFDSLLLSFIKKAIRESYVSFGWNLNSSTNERFKTQAYNKEVKAFPTIYDVLNRIEDGITDSITDPQLQLTCLAKVKDALQDWTIGRKGALLNAEHSMNLTGLLDQNCCIIIEELVDRNDRCFFILLYLFRCVALRKSQGRYGNFCNHLNFVEGMENLQERKDLMCDGFENAYNTIREYLNSGNNVGERILWI